MPLAVAVVAWTHRDTLARAARLLAGARLGWLVPAVLAVALVYLCRAYVYRIPLDLLRFSFTRGFLWSAAVVATSVHQLVPSGGASGYAVLTYALNQRGVPAGQASLIAVIDTLSYGAATATLLLAGLVYLAAGGEAGTGRLLLGLLPGVVLVALAGYVYVMQRDARRFVPLVLRLKDRLAALVGRRWPDPPIRAFLAEFYQAKTVIGRRPGPFARMVGFQYVALAGDAGALYLAFLAVGARPHPWIAVMGFVLATAGVAVVAAPGGGGSFELIVASFGAAHGLEAAQGLAAAVLYRVAAFWLPVAVSLVLLARLRRRRPERDQTPRTRAA